MAAPGSAFVPHSTLPEPGSIPAKRLLVVEDDPEMRALEVMLLADEGFAVDTASNGQDALARVETTRYDAIVLDVGLPDLDGFEIARRVRTLAANRLTPLVMVTGTCDRGAWRQGFETGVAVFMQKPMTPSAFRTAVTERDLSARG